MKTHALIVVMMLMLATLACSLTLAEPEPVVTATPTLTITPSPSPTSTATLTPTPTITPSPQPTIDLSSQMTENEVIADQDVECVLRNEWQNDYTIPTVPVMVAQASLQKDPEARAYVVQSGDTLIGISFSVDIPVDQLQRFNNMGTSSNIFAGQSLKLEPDPTAIPSATPPAFPTVVTNFAANPPILYEGEAACWQLITERPARITGTFMDNPLRVISNPAQTQHTFLIGVPIFTEPRAYPINLSVIDNLGNQQDYAFDVQIYAGRYGSEKIELTDQQLQLLAPEIDQAELATLANITRGFTIQRYGNVPMRLPSNAPINAVFGLRRSYNGGPTDRYHNGTDFSAVPDAPIQAAASGVVVLRDALNVRGNTTVIDHGWGVYTVYAHQKEVYVALGDEVKIGEIIGTVGTTGRSTGAHLHWEVWVNGVAVNPLQFTVRR